MEIRGSMMSVREDIRILDATLRDGGLVNNFEFLKDTEGTRQGYPRRTFASGMYLNGFSDHFPTEILLRREVRRAK